MANISFSYENPLKSRFGEAFFKNLPKAPAVYYFLDERGSPLYIGKADDLRRRLMSYQAAKPGQTSEHILEMIEFAQEIRWEDHDSGEAALRREAELIRAIKPPYNVALTEPIDYLYLGIRHLGIRQPDSPTARTGRQAVKAGKSSKARPGEPVPVEFRLSNSPIDGDYKTYGCFRHRGKTKAGYTAMLRLFFAALCPRERFVLPAKICRSSPPYIYATELPREWIAPLEAFFAGQSNELLHIVLARLLEKTELPRQLYIPLQRDFSIAKDFFEAGPKDTYELAKRVTKKRTYLTKAQMDRFVAKEFAQALSTQS